MFFHDEIEGDANFHTQLYPKISSVCWFKKTWHTEMLLQVKDIFFSNDYCVKRGGAYVKFDKPIKNYEYDITRVFGQLSGT